MVDGLVYSALVGPLAIGFWLGRRDARREQELVEQAGGTGRWAPPHFGRGE